MLFFQKPYKAEQATFVAPRAGTFSLRKVLW